LSNFLSFDALTRKS